MLTPAVSKDFILYKCARVRAAKKHWKWVSAYWLLVCAHIHRIHMYTCWWCVGACVPVNFSYGWALRSSMKAHKRPVRDRSATGVYINCYKFTFTFLGMQGCSYVHTYVVAGMHATAVSAVNAEHYLLAIRLPSSQVGGNHKLAARQLNRHIEYHSTFSHRKAGQLVTCQQSAIIIAVAVLSFI